MRLAKSMRIFLCCLVVVSVGAVLVCQGSAWAKDNGRIADMLKNRAAMGRANRGALSAAIAAPGANGTANKGALSGAISAPGANGTANKGALSGAISAARPKGGALSGAISAAGSRGMVRGGSSLAIKAPKNPTIKGLPGEVAVKLKK